MIASRTDARLPKIRWTRDARGSMAELVKFISENSSARPKARRLEIEAAIQTLQYMPLRCEVVAVRNGQVFRRLVVGGLISIRAVKHAFEENPFFGVRENVAV